MTDAQDISALPAPGQAIIHDGKRYTTIKEGLAHILVPEGPKAKDDTQKKAKSEDDAGQQVFYNPIQQFNRDLSVLAIRAHAAEALARRGKKVPRHNGKKRKRQDIKEEAEEESVRKLEKLSVPEASQDATAQAARGAAELKQEDEAITVGQAAAEADAGAEAAPSEGNTGITVPKGPKLRILDALSATGLRALRYAHELPFNTLITANDLLAVATESIKLNVKHNRLEDKITVSKGDALAHMYTLIAKELNRNHEGSGKSEKYDVIDLDPYGSAAAFFDAALQSVRDDGGLLCVTCTDAGVWASQGYPEKTFALYGGIPMKGSHSHEAGLRIILQGIMSSAARYGLVIEPLLSLSIDFYCRVFVRVRRSPAGVKFQAGKTMFVYNCDSGCGAWSTQMLLRNRTQQNKSGNGVFYKHSFAMAPTAEPECEHCGMKTHLSGPMYAGPIHSPEFIRSVLDLLPEVSKDTYRTTERIRGMLQTALEEIMEIPSALEESKDETEVGTDKVKAEVKVEKSKEDELAALDPCPLFFLPTQLARVMHCQTPGDDMMRGALRRLGYEARRSHCKGGSIKTNAPWSVVWEIMREWVRQKAPVKEENIKPGTAAYTLLGLGKSSQNQVEEKNGVAEDKPKLEVVFDEKLGREPNKEKLVRYQANPRENWGPMARARGK